jgi:ribosomal protein S18 acetylase RimI-like enzyme
MSQTTSHDIRLLAPTDSRLLRELLAVFGAAFDDEPRYLLAQPSDAYLEQLLGGDTFVALVACDAGRVIGGAAAYVLPKFEQACNELYLYDLAVAETHRRRGVATALIVALGRVARERHAEVLYVQADIEDAPAIALYDRLGSRSEVLHFDLRPGADTRAAGTSTGSAE